MTNIWLDLPLDRHKSGYVRVKLYDSGSTRRKHYLVHRLILEAFLGPCPPGKEGRHIDSDRGHNSLENLKWDTRRENTLDQIRRGSHHMAKLTPDLIRQIREEVAGGASCRSVSLRLGLGPKSNAIWYMIAGKTWKHVEDGVEYRTVAEHPGYRFTSDGRIQSCWAGIGWKSYRSRNWRDLVRVINPAGYFIVTMKRRGKQRATHVHHLIAEAFLGPRPPGMFACHNDGNPQNNRVENLRYDTHQGNEDDKREHGTRPQGIRVWSAKLDDEKVREIRRLRKEHGSSILKLGKRYGVHHSIISDVCNYKTWKHVE